MGKRLQIEKYGLHNYDDFLCLRPPLVLIACVIFLCRGLVVYTWFAVSGGARSGLSGIVDTEALNTGCLAAAPALLVLYALVARAPSAPALVRWTWRHGRALMSLSALSYVVVAVVQLASDRRHWFGASSLAVNALLVAELGVIAYVFLSSRVRQVFLDFPAA